MPEATLLLKATGLNLKRRHKQVLTDIDLELHAGQILTLIGPNGCGKSTLIRVLLGLESIDSGSVWRRKPLTVGYMPQQLQLEPRLPLTVLGFLRLARGARDSAIHGWIQRLGIQRLTDQDIQDLSGGEWQRVLLARALLLKPDLLVLDEPVQGVDVQGQHELYQLIPTLRDELGCGVLMVSHDLHLVMAATDEVICMNGHICCSGHPDHVSGSEAYQQLFGQRTAPIAHYTHHHDHQHCLDGHIDHDQTAETGQP
ncbi:ATP-binding cassette domain-containing protein [Candidatus Thalassolituus haligoni]|uniref:ATP-binding cassette domain-containing protein n=1 Tax=Candidatus Thalassolituus haligoni TaxID=3100113 RepID=UPI003517413B|tara:strand:- start:481 stop:1248 length:768 start_codon:yes stop_codon:yes gene_type:complete